MKQLVFAVYDAKAHAYTPPFYVHTEGMAVRGFGDAVNDPNHAFGKHPEDYTLYCLGTFNDTTAHFDLKKEAQIICKGLSLVTTKIIPDEAQSSIVAKAIG